MIKVTNINRWLSAIAGITLLGACAATEEYYGPCDLEPGTIKSTTLNVRLHTAGNAAISRSSGHELTSGTTVEDYINPDDIKVFVFKTQDNSDVYAGELTDFQFDWRWNSSYTAEDLYLVKDLGNLSGNGLFTAGMQFKLMVVVNGSSSFKGGSVASQPAAPFTTTATLDGVYAGNPAWNFTYPTLAGNTTWQPGVDNDQYIPAFGVSSGLAIPATPGAVNADVPLLRSLAKIEIVDRIPGGSVTSASISKINTSGRYIPDVTNNPQWNQEATQITTPSIPASVVESTTALNFVKVTETDPDNGNEVEKWVAYVPEFDLTKYPTIGAATRPHVNLSVASAEATLDYTLHFATYAKDASGLNSVPTTAWSALRRNHIYRYTLNSVNINADLTLNVLPWDLDTDEIWYYEDLPGSIDPIKWSYGDGSSVEQDGATLTLKISSDPKDILKGTFIIDQPLSGNWHAYLMTVGDAIPSAVAFCNPDGSDIVLDGNDENFMATHISGAISADKNKADEATIYIKAASTAIQQKSNFKLLIMVENMGNWMEVDLAGMDDATNWIIVRPSNEY